MLVAIGLIFALGEGLIRSRPSAGPAAPVTAPTPLLVPEPMEPPARAVLEAFFEAPDLTAKAKLVRDGARVRPLMEDYYNRQQHPLPTMSRVSKGHPARSEANPLVLFEVESFGGVRYPVAVIWDGRRFVVDWESMSVYGTMKWSEFLESRPSAVQTLRVFLQAAVESDAPPNMPAGAAAFRVSHRDDPEFLIAFANPDVAALLQPLVENRKAPMTLEMSWKPSPAGKGLVPVIDRMVATRWSR